jgi:gamma-glutamylcyclotransferase (GGCT)/AIG2-like uncharacterized protein YtfP
MKRFVFTFGTLYVDEIIAALLGTIPKNFYASLPGYAVYKGKFAQLPVAAQNKLRHLDPDTFSFLFAKPDPSRSLEGRVYEVSLQQEMILDHWELYPDWYRKQAVTVHSGDGKQHEAIIYTVDYDGARLDHYERVVNDLAEVIESAKAARIRAIDQHPQAFTGFAR